VATIMRLEWAFCHSIVGEMPHAGPVPPIIEENCPCFSDCLGYGGVARSSGTSAAVRRWSKPRNPASSFPRDFRDAWAKLFARRASRSGDHDMRRSAIRNAIRRGVDRDTVKQLSGHLTDYVFSAYNIQATDDLRDAARKIEDGASRDRNENRN